MKKNLNLTFLLSVLMVLHLSIEKASAQWTSTGPNGGYVNIIINSGTTMYACGGGGLMKNSLYSSIDNGATWSPVLSATWPGARALAKIGTSLFATGNTGIFRSDDNGLTWVNKYAGGWGYCFASNNTTIFVGTNDAVLRSTDNGETWTSIAVQGVFVPSLLAVGTTIYAGGINSGVVRSTDDGLTFQTYSGGTEHMDWAQIYSLAIIGTDIYAGSNGYGIFKLNSTTNVWSVCPGTATYSSITAITGDASTIIAVANNGVIGSTDAGASWTDVSGNGMDVSTENENGAALMTASGIFVGTFGGIYKTTNSGTSWARSDNGIHCQSIKSPSVITLGTDIFTGTSFGGVYRSSDLGQTWTDVSEGLSLNEYQDYATPKFVGVNATTLFSGAYMSNDAGASWTLHNSPGKVGNLPWIVQDGVYITMDANNGIYRSTDNGSTWVLNPLGMVGSLCSDGTTLYLTNPPVVAMDPFLYYSNDAGATWIQSTLNTPGYSNPYGNLYFIGNSMLFISTQSGIYEGQGIWRSTNHGESWTRVLANYGGGRLTFGENIMYVSGVYTNPNNGDQTPAMYKSENDGLTWTLLEYLENSLEATLTASGSNVFAATATYAYGLVTDSKIMMSSDKCVTWTDISDGWLFNKVPVSSMTILNNRIYAATAGGSLWQRDIDELTLPAQPSAIIGVVSPCANSTQTYSVNNVATITYTWQLPADWTILSGQTTNSITVTVGSQSGFISVSPSNNFGIGLLQIISVLPSVNAPAQPSAISGSATPCAGSTLDYSTTNIAGLTYNWTLPSDWIITSGQTSNSISVTVGNETGNMEVTPSNSCFAGIPQILAVITNHIPVQPSAISGSTVPVTGTMEIYSVTNTLGVSYEWTLPTNWIIISGNTSNLIVVTVVGSASGNITCTPSNDCGGGIAQSLAVVAKPNAINDFSSNNFISVYPNPSNGIFNATITSATPDIFSIQVYNSVGNLVYKQNKVLVDGNVKLSIDMQSFQSGIYMVIFTSRTEQIIRKMVINRD